MSFLMGIFFLRGHGYRLVIPSGYVSVVILKAEHRSEDEIAGAREIVGQRPRGGCSSDVAARLDVKKKTMEEKGDGIRRPMIKPENGLESTPNPHQPEMCMPCLINPHQSTHSFAEAKPA
jgi:hypothetical protein